MAGALPGQARTVRREPTRVRVRGWHKRQRARAPQGLSLWSWIVRAVCDCGCPAGSSGSGDQGAKRHLQSATYHWPAAVGQQLALGCMFANCQAATTVQACVLQALR